MEDLWNKIQLKGVRSELLREMLMFYLQHKIFTPPVQKSFDALLMKYYDKGTSKKMGIMIFQIVEEICTNLESSIIETLTFSPNNRATVELLNCTLIGGFVALLDEISMEKLYRSV